MALVEAWMGRTWICTCGYVKLWEGNNFSEGNSQHLFDWYTWSHTIHGFIFYWALWKWGRKDWSVGLRLLLATVIEVGWEVLENSPVIIDRYREGTVSLDYYGDSVLNSVMDVWAMVVGFVMAWKWPVKWIVIGAIMMELVAGWWIRDNLLLNVIMLIRPIEAIKEWQLGAMP